MMVHAGKMIHFRKVSLVTTVAAALIFLCTNYSSASLTQNVFTETPSELKLQWTWIQVNTEEISIPGTYWDANLTLGPKVGNAGWVVGWGFQHLQGPHDDDIKPAPFFSTADFALGSIIARDGYWAHPLDGGGQHWDHWSFSISEISGGVDNDYSIIFNVSHVPIPAAAWMLGAGLIGLVVVRRRKVS